MPKISYTMRVERPIEDLAEILGSRPPDWLVPFASIAVHAGDAAGARRAGTSERGPRRARRILIELSDPPVADDSDRIDAALHWRTTGFRWAFAVFDGRIEVTRESPRSSTVSLEGVYEPPRAAVGPEGEALAAHAAGITLAVLLRTLRDAVEEQVRSGA